MRSRSPVGFAVVLAGAVGCAVVLGSWAEAAERWVVESVGYSDGRHSASCVRAADWRPDYHGPVGWPQVKVTIDREAADRLDMGEPCPGRGGAR